MPNIGEGLGDQTQYTKKKKKNEYINKKKICKYVIYKNPRVGRMAACGEFHIYSFKS